MSVRTRAALLTAGVGTCLVAGALASGTAGAAPAGSPRSGDARATAVAGNATTCTGAGLPGTIVAADASVDGTGTYLTITSVPAGATLTGVVVKGGPAFNVYAGDQRTSLHAPLVASGKPAAISHWFACGAQERTTSTPPSTVPPSGTPPSGTGATPPAPSGAVPTTGVVQQPSTVISPQLAATGAPVRAMLGIGGLLLLAGGALLVGPALARRRPAHPTAE